MSKILVVDDDEMMIMMARHILSTKYEVVTAETGAEAIEIFDKERPDMVLSDLMMPEMDGMETLAEIRAGEWIKNVPVMMLTATVEKDLIQRARALDVTDYIKKPFMPADLIQRVEKKLSKIHSEEILLIGDDEGELCGMKELI